MVCLTNEENYALKYLLPNLAYYGLKDSLTIIIDVYVLTLESYTLKYLLPN